MHACYKRLIEQFMCWQQPWVAAFVALLMNSLHIHQCERDFLVCLDLCVKVSFPVWRPCDVFVGALLPL